MAVKAWFNYSTYMANKLVQMQETYPDENWTSAKLNAAFEKAGFVGDTGAQAHFQKYGHTEDVSPNKYFDAKYYYESKAIKYYTEQVAESQRMTKDEVLKDLDTYAKNMEGAIKAAHMDAWTHYIKYGTAEGVNPSNSFSTSNYMADKLAALQAADPSAGWTEESMNAAFKKAGLNALEHFMEYAGKSESEVSSTDIATYVVPEDQQIDDGSTTGDKFTLTTDLDNPAMTTGDDVVTGITANDGAKAAGATLNAGDVISDKSTTDNDSLNLTVSQASNNGVAVEITNVENINIKNALAKDDTFNAVLVSGSKLINANVVQEGTTEIIDQIQSAEIGVGLEGKGNLTANYAESALSGKTDDANVTLNGVGTSEEKASAITLDKAGKANIEQVTVHAKGTNFFTIDGGTGVTKYVLDGDGVNNVVSFTGAANMEIDASAAKGTQTYSLTNFSGKATGGSATDDTAEIDLGKTATVKPTLSGFENVIVNASVAGIKFDGTNLSGTSAIGLTGTTSGAATLTNLAADTTTVNIGDATAVDLGDVDVNWAKGTSADATINIGAANATKKVSVDTGALTVKNNAGALTINSVGTKVNTVNAVKADDVAGAVSVVAKDANLTISTTLQANKASSVTYDGSAHDLTVTTGSTLTHTANAFTAKSGDGAVSVGTITLTATKAVDTDFTFTGGDKALTVGNMAITDGGNDRTLDFVVSGEGKGDVSVGTLTLAAAATGKSTSVTYDVDNNGSGKTTLADISVLGVSGKEDATFTGDFAAKDGSVTINKIALTDTDTAEITLDANGGNVTLTDLTMTSIKSLDLTLKAAAESKAELAALNWTAGEISSVTMSGEGDATLSLGTSVYTGDLTVDASGLTGTLDFLADKVKGAVEVNYKGSNDVSTYSIKTGSGVDTVTVGAGDGTINTGDGADLITLGEGADIVELKNTTGETVKDATFATATKIAANDKITFDAVKTIAKFGEDDKLVVADPTKVNDLVGADSTGLTASETYIGYGTVDSTGVFTLAAGYDSTTTAAVVFYDVDNAALTSAKNVVLLTGIEGEIDGAIA